MDQNFLIWSFIFDRNWLILNVKRKYCTLNNFQLFWSVKSNIFRLSSNYKWHIYHFFPLLLDHLTVKVQKMCRWIFVKISKPNFFPLLTHSITYLHTHPSRYGRQISSLTSLAWLILTLHELLPYMLGHLCHGFECLTQYSLLFYKKEAKSWHFYEKYLKNPPF